MYLTERERNRDGIVMKIGQYKNVRGFFLNLFVWIIILKLNGLYILIILLEIVRLENKIRFLCQVYELYYIKERRQDKFMVRVKGYYVILVKKELRRVRNIIGDEEGCFIKIEVSL